MPIYFFPSIGGSTARHPPRAQQRVSPLEAPDALTS